VACVRQLVGVYFAMGDTKTPVLVAALDFAVFLTLAVTLRGPFGHVGISLAVSGASLAQMLLLWLQLRKRLVRLHTREITTSALKSLLAAAAAGAIGLVVARASAGALGDHWLPRMLPGLAGGASFGVVFLVVAKLLKSEELSAIAGPLVRRLKRARS
jgi:putative peptidoglycan lipid II flippase